MAKNYTGIDGALYVDNVRVAQTQSWTLSANAAVLPTTTLGDFAETSVYGLQSFSGSAAIYYYESDSRQIDGSDLLVDVLRTTQTPTNSTHQLKLVYLGGSKTRQVVCDCLLNTVEVSATAGEIVMANITFTVTGPLTTATIA